MQYYSSSIHTFLNSSTDEILGIISANNQYDLTREQRNSFLQEINLFKKILDTTYNGHIIFEYTIPRIGKRIDVILLVKNIVFSIEFKVGSASFLSEDHKQAYGYGIELQCFHKLSQNHLITPILVATEADQDLKDVKISKDQDENLFDLIQVNALNLKNAIDCVIENYGSDHDPEWTRKWESSICYAIPSLVDATVALFNNHNVADITNCESQENLTKTTDTIIKIIDETKLRGGKSIIFVTGVPGAGKSLVGLNIASKGLGNDDRAVYLSGNAPLVDVLREQLIRNWQTKVNEKTGRKFTKEEADVIVTPLIQIVHNYRDAMLDKLKVPIENGHLEIDLSKASKDEKHGYAEVEHIAIFDEAQRSWTQDELCKFLNKNNKGSLSKNFPFSEAGFLIWSMNLRKDWAVIICLVGGGQEIFKGEAGILEWVQTIKNNFSKWDLYMGREQLTGLAYKGDELKNVLDSMDQSKIHDEEHLHLKTGIRSIRSNKVAKFAESVLDCDIVKATDLYKKVIKKYPIYLTRSLDRAKQWLAEKSDHGKNRVGLLVSSRGGRAKALGVTVKQVKDNPKKWYTNWFLNEPNDIRSSSFLEDAGSEFIVQGLELDYVGLIWEADFRYNNGSWQQFKFTGSNWQNVDKETEFKDSDEKQRHYNAYRILLTRARQGMIIIVPQGCLPNSCIPDSTRNPAFYDGTFNYLKSIGIKELPF